MGKKHGPEEIIGKLRSVETVGRRPGSEEFPKLLSALAN